MARRGHKGQPRQPGMPTPLHVEPEDSGAVAQVSLPSTIRVAPVVEPAGGVEAAAAAPETTASQVRPAVASVPPFAAPPPAEEQEQEQERERVPEPSALAPTSTHMAVVVTAPRAITRSAASDPGGFPPGTVLDPRLVLLREPDSTRSAAFRVLRHRLVERGDPRSVGISSAQAGEGKTECAVNLALATAEAARGRVLLIEANLRAPALAAIFEALPALDPMAARLPSWPLPAPWSVLKRYSPWLDVVAVDPGQATAGPLDGASWGRLMDCLRSGIYDRIVIDGPAVLGSADVNLIEDYVDAVLLVAWSRRSSARTLRRAVEQLEPVKLAGITLLDA